MSKSPKRNREYMREYMRKRRANVNPSKPHEPSNVNPLEGANVNPLEGANVNPSSPHSTVPAFDPEDVREYFEERAAILEFDHGMSRADAEQEARRRTLARYGALPELGEIES